MEIYQYNQKGPMAPINGSTIVDDVIPGIEQNSAKRPTHHGEAELLKHIAIVEKRYAKYINFRSKHITSLDFENAWLSLPSSSVRGIPFLQKGSDIDSLITRLFGKTVKPALNQFKQVKSLITTPGLRIQGSPM